VVYEYIQKKRMNEARQTAKKILALYPKNAELKAEFNSILEGDN